jgi:Cu/Ag efflux protein CusF
MGAMTMDFPVVEGASPETLEVGDDIAFSIEVPETGFRIVRIETVDEVPEGAAREVEP